MDDSVQDVFFTNLLLLGLKPDVMERKYKIPFNKYEKYSRILYNYDIGRSEGSWDAGNLG